MGIEFGDENTTWRPFRKYQNSAFRIREISVGGFYFRHQPTDLTQRAEILQRQRFTSVGQINIVYLDQKVFQPELIFAFISLITTEYYIWS